MSGSISIRRSIRWPPDDASEPTSTIVLTSPGRLFVDVRILTDEHGQVPSGDDVPLDRLDWAIAGTSFSSSLSSQAGAGSWHARWEHWIDSRTDAAAAADEADMVTLGPDNVVLEKGAMVNPQTGRVAPYEEIWEDEDVPGGQGRVVVLRWEDRAAAAGGHGDDDDDDGGSGSGSNSRDRGLAIRLGRYCQGIVKIGGRVTVERWEHGKRVVRMGAHEELPCALMVKQQQQQQRDEKREQEQGRGGAFRRGDEVRDGQGRRWTVVEAS
ncbi:hypothetical protein AAL_02778 [Moelleriella libera RCEF 2490]|uniref:Protein HRI1 n=1 Tax=Moelleriella libera RCEF 2490 TaxID=1081109 RepID=A0A168EWR6_9HYPO|nr:hypothetical protein AAL_02778 [Moelleriella libera RCEF 2490]